MIGPPQPTQPRQRIHEMFVGPSATEVSPRDSDCTQSHHKPKKMNSTLRAYGVEPPHIYKDVPQNDSPERLQSDFFASGGRHTPNIPLNGTTSMASTTTARRPTRPKSAVVGRRPGSANVERPPVTSSSPRSFNYLPATTAGGKRIVTAADSRREMLARAEHQLSNNLRDENDRRWGDILRDLNAGEVQLIEKGREENRRLRAQMEQQRIHNQVTVDLLNDTQRAMQELASQLEDRVREVATLQEENLIYRREIETLRNELCNNQNLKDTLEEKVKVIELLTKDNRKMADELNALKVNQTRSKPNPKTDTEEDGVVAAGPMTIEDALRHVDNMRKNPNKHGVKQPQKHIAAKLLQGKPKYKVASWSELESALLAIVTQEGESPCFPPWAIQYLRDIYIWCEAQKHPGPEAPVLGSDVARSILAHHYKKFDVDFKQLLQKYANTLHFPFRLTKGEETGSVTPAGVPAGAVRTSVDSKNDMKNGAAPVGMLIRGDGNILESFKLVAISANGDEASTRPTSAASSTRSHGRQVQFSDVDCSP